ncbi:MAG: PEP-utilizing enzyme [Dermatophilaceae bacterium]
MTDTLERPADAAAMRIPDPVPGFMFDEAVDFEQSPAWFLDGTHSVPPWTPLFGWSWINYCRAGVQYGAEKIGLPKVKGWDWRFHQGGGYLTVMTVKSERERAEREARFREGIRPFIEDFDGLWGGLLQEMLDRYERLKAVDLAALDNFDALEQFEQALGVTRRMWEIHTYMMYGTFTGFILFENMCRDILGIDDTSPLFHTLITGFDNKVLQVDKRIWEFSKQAEGMGLAEVFRDTPPEQVEAALSASPAGRDFMTQLRDFLQHDGWRAQRMAEINLPTWVEDPTPVMTNIKQFLSRGGDFNLDEERARISAQRERAEAEVLAKVAPQQKGWFTTLLRLAQKSGVFSEEHDHYLDLYSHALLRRAAVEVGRRMHGGGAIDDPEDVLFLIPDEIRKAAINPDNFDLRPVVTARRAEWESWLQAPNPPVLLKPGYDMEQAMAALAESQDPIALKVVVGAMPVVREELKADLYGTCGSPGVCEGVARVILREDEIAEVKPGEILVAASTSVSWTPVFSFIAGVVVDRGASLSHAAIVGREYGIPVLMNVFVGTETIRTGQRIRVDANLGALYLLDGD